MVKMHTLYLFTFLSLFVMLRKGMVLKEMQETVQNNQTLNEPLHSEELQAFGQMSESILRITLSYYIWVSL